MALGAPRRNLLGCHPAAAAAFAVGATEHWGTGTQAPHPRSIAGCGAGQVGGRRLHYARLAAVGADGRQLLQGGDIPLGEGRWGGRALQAWSGVLSSSEYAVQLQRVMSVLEAWTQSGTTSGGSAKPQSSAICGGAGSGAPCSGSQRVCFAGAHLSECTAVMAARSAGGKSASSTSCSKSHNSSSIWQPVELNNAGAARACSWCQPPLANR